VKTYTADNGTLNVLDLDADDATSAAGVHDRDAHSDAERRGVARDVDRTGPTATAVPSRTR
jgi:hypothetical protein